MVSKVRSNFADFKGDDAMNLLRKIFGEWIISKNAEFIWVSRLHDLTAPDVFF